MRKAAFPFALGLVVALCVVSPALSQQSGVYTRDDTTAQVRELTDFHGVIFTIWHTAWPNKNTAMLRELLPEVERHADNIRRAQLPGILRDKQQAWDENVERLMVITREYRDAATAADSQKLLGAAERLHAQYEKLVRVTKPVLKELDEFHRVLYMLYHHYLPEHNLDKLASSVAELKEKMAVLEGAQLVGRAKDREVAFREARARLARSVAALDAAIATSNPDKFASAVESMHTEYQKLERVFE